MAELTGKAISELPEAQTVQDADLIAVSRNASSMKMKLGTLLGNLLKKTGATMTGELNLQSTSNTIGTRPASTVSDRRIYFRDLAETIFVKLQSLFYSDGKIGMQLGVQRTVSDNLVENLISLSIDEDGNRGVSVSEASKWRSALGIGSSGNLPILLSQGGTSSTGVSTTSTISSIATAASGFAINNAVFSQWGKLAMLRLEVTNTNELSAYTNVTVATLVSGKQPVQNASGSSLNSTVLHAMISTDRSVHIVTNAAVAAGTRIYLFFTYMLP